MKNDIIEIDLTEQIVLMLKRKEESDAKKIKKRDKGGRPLMKKSDNAKSKKYLTYDKKAALRNNRYKDLWKRVNKRK